MYRGADDEWSFVFSASLMHRYIDRYTYIQEQMIYIYLQIDSCTYHGAEDEWSSVFSASLMYRYIQIHLSIDTHTYIYIFRYLYLASCTYHGAEDELVVCLIYIYIHTHTHIYIYIYIYVYIYIYIYISRRQIVVYTMAQKTN